MSHRLAFWTALFSLLPVMEASAGIIVNYAQTLADVEVFANPGFESKVVQQPDLAGASVTATLYQLSSQVTSSFSESGLSASLSQSGEGNTQDYLTGYAVASFTAMSDMAYRFSGAIVSNGSDYTVLNGYLLDNTTNTYLFYSYQDSIGSASFTLGLLEGNYGNALEGSPSGFLQAGHAYTWQFFARSDAITDIPLSATASAEIRFTEVSAVPEPSSLVLLLSSMGGFGLLFRRRFAFGRNH